MGWGEWMFFGLINTFRRWYWRVLGPLWVTIWPKLQKRMKWSQCRYVGWSICAIGWRYCSHSCQLPLAFAKHLSHLSSFHYDINGECWIFGNREFLSGNLPNIIAHPFCQGSKGWGRQKCWAIPSRLASFPDLDSYSSIALRRWLTEFLTLC